MDITQLKLPADTYKQKDNDAGRAAGTAGARQHRDGAVP